MICNIDMLLFCGKWISPNSEGINRVLSPRRFQKIPYISNYLYINLKIVFIKILIYNRDMLLFLRKIEHFLRKIILLFLPKFQKIPHISNYLYINLKIVF